jgi:Common central domain of tyrosinase/von Willebrand factor type A domain
MRCRKNFVDLSTDERNWLADGLNALYAAGVVAAYADEHNAAFNNGIHHGPAFLPWHRHFLFRFEQALRSVEARATLPYWDWTRTDDSQNIDVEPWKSFFGGRSNTGGRFDHWDLSREAAPQHHAGELPTLDGVIDELTSATYASFRTIEFLSHVPGHTWTGGTMAGGRSPADPLFYLHHGNVDRLWAIWQRANPTVDQYTLDEDDCATCDRTQAAFVPLNSPMIGGATPASMLDRGPFGYFFPSDSRLENRVIERGLAPMASGDAISISLDTPSVVFNAVPEGDTTHRAALFTIGGCGSLSFEVTAQPAAPFSLASPGPYPWPVGPLHTDELRVWLAFTGQAPGTTSSGSVSLLARDAFGAEVGRWDDIPIVADSVRRPRVAVSLVLDESGSMLYDAGNNRRRLDVLRIAAHTFVDQLYDDNGLAIVSFADGADIVLDLAEAVSGSHRDDARNEINAHGPPNNQPHTSIGAGLRKSAEMYEASPASAGFDIRASVVFTDGFEDRAPLIHEIRDELDEHVYAVGIANAANVRNDILGTVAHDTGGFMLVTGAVTQDDDFLLEKFFIQVLAGVTNRQIIRDPEGWIVPGQISRVPFSIARSDIAFDALALVRPAPYVAIALQTPAGRVVTAADLPAGGAVVGPTSSALRVTLPVVVDGVEYWEGEWQLLLALGLRSRDAELTHISAVGGLGNGAALRYHAIVHARSNLQMRTDVSASASTPGSSLFLRAMITEYGQPIETHPIVSAHVTYPDGAEGEFSLSEQTMGAFSADLLGSQAGVYRFLVSASGYAYRGERFTREQLLTVVLGPTGLGG